MTGNFLVPVSPIVGPCAGDFRGSGFRLGRILRGREKHKTSSAYMLSNKGIYTNDVFDISVCSNSPKDYYSDYI